MAVTQDAALQVSAFYSGVRIISEDIGKLPFPVYRRLPDDQRARARDSRYWSIVHDRAYSRMTSQQFRELLTAHALMRGDGFAFKSPLGPVRKRELLPINPTRVEVEQTDDYELLYHVTMADGTREKFTRQDIFHLPGLSFNGARGTGVLTLARQTLGLTIATERHGATTFGNGAKPGGVFKHPKAMSDVAYDRLKRDLDDGFNGESSNSTMILEDGLEWMQVGLSNEDSQFLETRKFQVSEIARWLRLPPHKLGDLERATFSNIEHQSLEYVTDTLFSWAKRWENAYNEQLIDADDEYAELLFDALLRPDTKTRYEAFRIAVGRPWMTGNEVRGTENLPFIEDDASMNEVILPKNLDAGGSPSTAEGVGASAS